MLSILKKGSDIILMNDVADMVHYGADADDILQHIRHQNAINK